MRIGRRARISAGLAVAAAALALPLMLDARLAKPDQAANDRWRRLPITRRGSTLLGISFRPRQVEAFGLEAKATLRTLLAYPFEMIRLAAYWNRIEARAGEFDTSELDWQLDAAELAGKQVILSVGAIKNFGYPEFYVPAHRLGRPIREGSVVRPYTHEALLSGATDFIRRVAERYRDRASIVAWQVEHEAVDPLGVEHSWRLGADLVEQEIEALEDADSTRPVMMNGFLPTSSLVRVSQWWRTRDQGDSLDVAARLADIVGIDYYPRHAVAKVGSRTLYLDGARLPWQRLLTRSFLESVRRRGKRLMVAEGQSEPWEAVTLPPNPEQRAMFSCRPEDPIRNYNAAMEWSSPEHPLYAYLFWGAEYWVLRDRSGDSSYRQAFTRILGEA
jgi:glycosyl hydrolase family 42 (putative beta-galactosidase)